ncbi:hypothetical protein CLF_106210, partial [Clonorchis sinensis]
MDLTAFLSPYCLKPLEPLGSYCQFLRRWHSVLVKHLCSLYLRPVVLRRYCCHELLP